MSGANLSYVHRFIPSSGSPYTLLLLHGTGGNETDLLDLGAALLPGAALVSPRGNVMEGPMPRFFRRLAEGVFDEEDLKRRTNELVEFIEAASTEYGFDAGKVIAVGYSNGANIAASLLLLQPSVLRGAALFRAMVPLQPPASPNLSGVPVLLAEGRHDPLVPMENAERLAAMLQSAGADVTLRWQEGGHGLARDEFAFAHEWLSKMTGDAAYGV